MKTTLIAVSGMSPAILTETVWALASENPPVVPDDVVVITTSKGNEDIQNMLLTIAEGWKGQNVWEHLRANVFARTGLPAKTKKLQLAVRVIDLPDETTGVRKTAKDLRTRADNDEAADFIVRVVDDWATDDAHVIASIAGGRKTMGALLYAAMSLRAKETDRVTHVLVSEPFENFKGFFYPDQPLQSLTVKPSDKPAITAQASDAKVEMADIPFVPLRNRFVDLQEPRRTFKGLVAAYSNVERSSLPTPPKVSIDEERGMLTVEGRAIKLTGKALLIAAFLYRRAMAGSGHFVNKDEAAADLAEFMANWRQQYPYHKAQTRLSGRTATVDDFKNALSTLRKELENKKLRGAIPYLAPDRGRIGFEIAS